MNVKRMEKLAAKLDTVPRRGFAMEWWVKNKMTDRHYEMSNKEFIRSMSRAEKNNHKCGMAACVGGWAVTVFPKHLKYSEYGMPMTRDDDERGEYAIAKVLGICVDHAAKLTEQNAPHQTPKAAAKFIRRLVKENPKCCQEAK